MNVKQRLLLALCLAAFGACGPGQIAETSSPGSSTDTAQAPYVAEGSVLWSDAETGRVGVTSLADGSYEPVFSDREIRISSLSPDGGWIAYWSEGYIFLLDLESGETTQLTSELVGSFQLGRLLWAPDGQSLALDCIPPSAQVSEICLVDRDSGALSPLSSFEALGLADSDSPALGSWSRDGQAIAFVLQDFPEEGFAKTSLAVFDLESGESEILLQETDYPEMSYIAFPSFSPDGSQILFQANWDQVPEIFLYDRATATLQQLTHSTDSIGVARPVWGWMEDAFLASVAGTGPGGDLLPYIALFAISGEVLDVFSDMPGWALDWYPSDQTP